MAAASGSPRRASRAARRDECCRDFPKQPPGSSQYDDARADVNSLVEIEDVAIMHADAAEGYESADRARVVGAMDGVLIDIERHCCCAHGIFWAATGDVIGRPWLLALERSRRRPRRTEEFSPDGAGTRPGS